MEPLIIDIAGTARQFMKWVVVQLAVILAVIAFGLSAPILFLAGALWLAVNFPDSAPTWAVLYLIAGPFACAFWMILLSALPKFVAICKRIRIRHDRDSYIRGSGRATGFMVAGFFGSLLTESVFTYAAHALSVIPSHLILYFSVAPLAVFAPCWIVVLLYWVWWDEYAIA